MTQDRKYFGMTTQQVGILAGLGLLACLLCGVSAVFALRGNLSGIQVGAPEVVSTVSPTSTMVITPGVVVTETPSPIPYEQLVPAGWTQYRTTLIELWFPAGFKPAASSSVATVAGNTVFLEMAIISTEKRSAYKTNVSVSYELLTAGTLEEFVDFKLSSIPVDVNMAERRKVSVNAQDAYRLVFERHGPSNLNTNDLVYVFQDGSTVWYVQYSAEITTFYELLSVFEQSVKTFRIVR